MITLKNVTKNIRGKCVLNKISYSFESGKIYGLHGRNGSGKTMLLRAICGLIVPSDGAILIDNKTLHEDISFPPSVGVIIEHMELLPQYNSYDNLFILSKINKIASEVDIKEAIKKVGLDPESKLKVKKFSLGMKQRLNIAQAIFEHPDIILLDEPTNAIDESGIKLIREVIKEEAKRGAIIIIASHNKEDINELCDVILKIENGEIINE